MIFLFTYRALLRFIKFLFQLFVHQLPFSLREWTLLRIQATKDLTQIPKSPATAKTIWFHVASGEIEYVKGVIREMRSTNPDEKIVLTYSSPSAKRLLFNIEKEIDQILPLPWDEARPIAHLIEVLQPKLIVFAKTDFWPELIHQARLQKIPIAVVSMTLLDQKKPNRLAMWALPKFSKILCADESTKQKLKALNVESEVGGDTRFDQVFFRLAGPSRIQIQRNGSQENRKRKCLVFASTWPADDHVLLQALPELIKNGYQIIWCPHDVGLERVENLSAQILNSAATSIMRLSHAIKDQPTTTTSITLSSPVLLVDQVGFLADLYRFSSFAFVGGSFHYRVHSVMEALCAGNTVFVGPKYRNNLEAIEFKNHGLVREIHSHQELLSQILNTTTEDIEKNHFEILNLCNQRRGAAKKIVQSLSILIQRA